MIVTPLRPAASLAALVSCLALLLSSCGSGNQISVCPGSVAGCGCAPAAACPAQFNSYLYAAGITGQISSFPITSASGTLETPTTISGPQGTLGMAVIDNAFLYASDPAAPSGGSIDGWTIDQYTGALTTLTGSPFNLGIFSTSGALAVNNNARVLYVADAGKIDALQVDSNSGALSAISGSPFPSGTGLFFAVDPADKFLFASDTTPPGNVLAYTIDSTGALTAVGGSPFPAVSGSTNTYPYQIVVDSTGKFVYVDLMFTNQIAAFAIDSSTGALTAVPGSPFSTGAMPTALATVRNFIYVSNSVDGTLSGYSIDPTTGALTAIPGSPFAISTGALATNSTGSFLYASGVDGIQAYGIDGSTGLLSAVGSPVSAPGAAVLLYVQ